MARRRHTARDATARAERVEQAEKALVDHLHRLGLATVQQYKAWCREHGFSSAKNKSGLQREKERAAAARRTEDARRAAVRCQYRNADQEIANVLRGTIRPQELFDPRLKALHRVLNVVQSDRRAKRAFERLLQHTCSNSHLFDARPAVSQLGNQTNNTFIDGLAAVALQWHAWHREVETWKVRSHNARRQFASLTRHLLAEYDVPAFMDAAWFLGTSPEAREQQTWFIHLAQGKNLRTAKLPIPYTKRMAHHFLKSPADYSIYAALRWGQIHGLGGDARLADAIRGTRLGESFVNEEFWITVLRFLIAHPMLDTVHVGPIIDFLHEQRYETRNPFVAPGVIQPQGPAQPNLSMSGRTPDSLLRQVHRWHRQLAKEGDTGMQWIRSGIRHFEFIEGSKESGNMRRWTIQELLSAQALIDEGRAMRHCVASYSGSCARRATSIWSLRSESYDGRQRVLTIEVRLAAKTICQARGRMNARPGNKARGIMQRWATREGLTIVNYV